MARPTPQRPSTQAWQPWHEVVELRADLRSGELPLSSFAADLYDVAMNRERSSRIYREPAEFFALTYPTYNLRELAKDVVLRLAGRNEKAVRQLELTYGGGKTHTLITLLHLVRDPASLPDLPAVQEFKSHIGIELPKTRVVVLPFDKLDVEKGMEVRGLDGATRWLKHPWSVLAFQIAGADGLRLLHPDARDDERESAPAENLLVDLLSLPSKEGLGVLVLIDEVLMYAREKVSLDPAWQGRLATFFQYLTQAATKVERCAVVASLLATDTAKYDAVGKQIISDLHDIFRREREEGVQPVLKEDVAEVLRRRFFTPDSIRDRESFRPHVVAALKGIQALDESTRRDGKQAEDRYLRSYPFHPDLTEVFYSKWTNLDAFQRTRGVLRTFALALRDAEAWDRAPLVGPNVFLASPDRDELSEAARELAGVAETESYEGQSHVWSAILQGELSKARELEQRELPSLKHRELEAAVFATFLHSQPLGQKAFTANLMVLVGATQPDKIDLEKGLVRWTEVSWFLDEAAIANAGGEPGAPKELPKVWRLGSKPNLRQMHDDACRRISPDLVEPDLLDAIGKQKNLTAGAAALGAKVHNLPLRPRDIEDDGEFHYGVLGPKAASESGKPSPEAQKFLDETTGADRPRVNRNAVVLAVPSREGLDLARRRIIAARAWEEVQTQLRDQEIDPVRGATLRANLEEARRKIAEAIEQAYCVVVTVSERNEAQAFKLSVESAPLFAQIKADRRSRIQDTAITPEALLPGGPYELWREGEATRWAKDLVGAFAQQPHLPKMLSRKAILETLVRGCIEGRFVVSLLRPDRSRRTWWRAAPDDAALADLALEAVLPEHAELSELACELLVPGGLPELWSVPELAVRDVIAYFGGGRVVRVQREGYEEPVSIPRADRAAVLGAIEAAVNQGRLWLVSGPASLLAEPIPAGLLNDDAKLLAPPPPISVSDLLPETLPEGWTGESTTALGLASALSHRAGRVLPWARVRDAISGAQAGRLLMVAEGSTPWPCDLAGAGGVKFRTSTDEVPPPLPPRRGRAAEAQLSPDQIQDLAEKMSDLLRASIGLELEISLRVQLGDEPPPNEGSVRAVNEVLAAVSPDLILR